MVSKILACNGATPLVFESFYKAIVQAVLLYGSKSWAMTDAMMKQLEQFHGKVACQILGCLPQRTGVNTWKYPPLVTAYEVTGLQPIQEYLRKRCSNIKDYIASRPILDLYQASPRYSGTFTS